MSLSYNIYTRITWYRSATNELSSDLVNFSLMICTFLFHYVKCSFNSNLLKLLQLNSSYWELISKLCSMTFFSLGPTILNFCKIWYTEKRNGYFFSFRCKVHISQFLNYSFDAISFDYFQPLVRNKWDKSLGIWLKKEEEKSP